MACFKGVFSAFVLWNDNLFIEMAIAEIWACYLAYNIKKELVPLNQLFFIIQYFKTKL